MVFYCFSPFSHSCFTFFVSQNTRRIRVLQSNLSPCKARVSKTVSKLTYPTSSAQSANSICYACTSQRAPSTQCHSAQPPTHPLVHVNAANWIFSVCWWSLRVCVDVSVRKFDTLNSVQFFEKWLKATCDANG